MKLRYYNFALLLGLFSVSLAIGQNGSPKKLSAKANFESYPVSGMLYSTDSTRYSYDDEGRYTDIYGWSSYSAANGWLLKRRTTEYVYDPNGNLLSYLTQWYSNTEGWLNSSRSLYTYDTNNSLLSIVEQDFKDSSGWVNYLRISLTYDAAGNRLSSVVENWKDSIWTLNNALYFTYDAAGHVLTRTTHDLYRITYAYDGAGNLLSETSMSNESGIWAPYYRTIYIYGFLPQQPAIGLMQQIWNGIEGWETYSKMDYSFNSAGDMTDILRQFKSGSGWVNDFRYHFEYNNNHQEVFNEYQDWENNAWAKHTRYYTTYDSDSDEILWRREQWNNAWYEISVTRYHYDASLPVHTSQLSDFLLFPNPANDVVTLKGAHLSNVDIFDLKGSLVASVNVFGENEKTLQLSNIPSGNYFIRLMTKDGKFSTKSLLVRH